MKRRPRAGYHIGRQNDRSQCRISAWLTGHQAIADALRACGGLPPVTRGWSVVETGPQSGCGGAWRRRKGGER
jgi:hypothetical protein